MQSRHDGREHKPANGSNRKEREEENPDNASRRDFDSERPNGLERSSEWPQIVEKSLSPKLLYLPGAVDEDVLQVHATRYLPDVHRDAAPLAAEPLLLSPDKVGRRRRKKQGRDRDSDDLLEHVHDPVPEDVVRGVKDLEDQSKGKGRSENGNLHPRAAP